ncbi:hypothetical protein P053_02907 [Brucella abortus 01-4165]|uniref:Uncharacterized protein n=1 Tax=Brucella abortus TaxID=235 RepID=A0AAE9ILL4_BRUAO|nr:MULTISPECIES: hypothetical protein [Brucella]ERT84147.1 hypothetical protein P050_01962 [Brucella abortus 90-12178]ERU10570.1 hypothetical protein P038_00186 [Brucella abortus 99-9971-135]AIJ53232.1 hypothetical protein DK48_124 [Brucella abortus]AIJ55152.1 hypothetical protein DK51_1561 [Brucella abortus]AIJ57431.1 hypothetical protein DO78_1899 [Brucella abortus]
MAFKRKEKLCPPFYSAISDNRLTYIDGSQFNKQDSTDVSRETLQRLLVLIKLHVSRESLPDAELREHNVQNFLDIHIARDPSKELRSKPHILGS